MLPDAEPGVAHAMDHVRDTFSRLRGGRMRGSSSVGQSRSAAPDTDGGPHFMKVLVNLSQDRRCNGLPIFRSAVLATLGTVFSWQKTPL